MVLDGVMWSSESGETPEAAAGGSNGGGVVCGGGSVSVGSGTDTNPAVGTTRALRISFQRLQTKGP